MKYFQKEQKILKKEYYNYLNLVLQNIFNGIKQNKQQNLLKMLQKFQQLQQYKIK